MTQGILDIDELDEVVTDYMNFDEFVFDVETMGEHRSDPHRNEVFWVSLAGPGRADVIPCGHPIGEVIERDPDDDFYRTYKGKRQEHRINESTGRPKWVNVPVPYEDPPKQLYVADVMDVLRPLFFSKKIRKIGQNVKFDLESVAKYYGSLPCPPYGDIYTAARLIDENHYSYKLGDMVKREFHFEYEKIGKAGPENFPYSEAYLYSYYDAKYEWLLWQKYKPVMEKENIRHIFDIEMDLLPAVMDAEQSGITIDTEVLDRLGEQFLSEMANIMLDIEDAYGGEINLNANAQVAELVYDIQGHTCKVYTPTGLRSTKAENLESYVKDPIVAQLLDYAKLTKLQNTFIEGIGRTIHDSGRIHPSFNPIGARTGRMSCREPNIQQIPIRSERGKQLREMFVAG